MAKPSYLTSSTNRIYTNPMLGAASSEIYQKTMNPMGVQQQAAPQEAQGAPAAIGSGFDLSKYKSVNGFNLPDYGAQSDGFYADYEEFLKNLDEQYGTTSGSNADNSSSGKSLNSNTQSSSSRSTTYASRKVVDVTKKYLGQNRYVYGKFDCSKFTQEVAGKAGEKIPRTAATQYNYFKTKRRLVGIKDAKAGDLIFMSSSASPSGWHVGIYIGNGQMIDNAGRGKPIAVRSIKGRRIKGFGRMNIKAPAPKVTSGGRVGTSNYTI